MSILATIKEIILGHRGLREAPPQQEIPRWVRAPGAQPGNAGPEQAEPLAAAAQQPVDEVDVEETLALMAKDKDLRWRASIIDLMHLLGIDSKLENRRTLARELGYNGELDGSAEMNVWLHRATMRELAKDGGKVPPEMLD